MLTSAVPVPSDAFGGDSLAPLRMAPKVMVVACAGLAKKQTRGRTGRSQAFFMNILPLAAAGARLRSVVLEGNLPPEEANAAPAPSFGAPTTETVSLRQERPGRRRLSASRETSPGFHRISVQRGAAANAARMRPTCE